MSDEEELVSEEEVEEDKPAPSSPTRKQAAPVEDAGPSEAELAMQKRRQAQISSAGLDEDATEMLQVNLKERQQMDQEIRELRKRSEQRKKEREEEERRNNERRNEEEARRKAEEEDRRRQKESSEDAKKAEREMKNAELQKLRNNTNKPNFIIAKKEGVVGSALEVPNETDGSMLGQKSKEQLEADKRHALQQRIPQLDISGYDTSKLADKAKELHNLIYRLESEKYDLEHRFKRQQYDMMELAEKARQMSKGGKGKKVQVSEETDKRQETFAGCPAKIEMYSKYERQKDKRHYGVRKDVFKGPTYGFPPPRIQPQRKLVWNEAGLPQYVDGEVEEGGQENHVDAAPGQEV